MIYISLLCAVAARWASGSMADLVAVSGFLWIAAFSLFATIYGAILVSSKGS